MARAATDSQELTIDREFEALCWALTPEETNLLETSLEAEGCRDPIIVWANHEDTILDGHNRYRICRQLGIPFKAKALKFETREEAIAWILNNQRGRRNAPDTWKNYARGKLYELRKKREGAPEGNDNAKKQLDNDCPVVSTAAQVAKECRCSEGTVKNDAKFAGHIDTIAAAFGKQAREVLVSVEDLSRKQVADIAALATATERKAEFKQAVAEAHTPRERTEPTLLQQLTTTSQFASKLKDKWPQDVWHVIADHYRQLAQEFSK